MGPRSSRGPFLSGNGAGRGARSSEKGVNNLILRDVRAVKPRPPARIWIDIGASEDHAKLGSRRSSQNEQGPRASAAPSTDNRVPNTGYRRRPFFAADFLTALRVATFDFGATFSFFCAPALLFAAFFDAVRLVPLSALVA